MEPERAPGRARQSFQRRGSTQRRAWHQSEQTYLLASRWSDQRVGSVRGSPRAARRRVVNAPNISQPPKGKIRTIVPFRAGGRRSAGRGIPGVPGGPGTPGGPGADAGGRRAGGRGGRAQYTERGATGWRVRPLAVVGRQPMAVRRPGACHNWCDTPQCGCPRRAAPSPDLHRFNQPSSQLRRSRRPCGGGEARLERGWIDGTAGGVAVVRRRTGPAPPTLPPGGSPPRGTSRAKRVARDPGRAQRGGEELR